MVNLNIKNSTLNTVFIISAAFITYCSMYAFRKPISSGVYEGLQVLGIDYKIVLITVQAIGYTISKFVGIKLISEMKPQWRILYILALLSMAWIGLLIFGILKHPWGIVGLFINGLPLGMIWGIVFSFLEGRRNTELLGVGMAVSFIISSGIVKSIGKFLVESAGISEFWMPFMTGTLFIVPLLIGVIMLSKIPSPSKEDIDSRTLRKPMSYKERKAFFKSFAPGIIVLVCIYISLTILRDLRDNFAVELWTSLGYPQNSSLLTLSEIPIAILVFIIVAAMILIKNNYHAFIANIVIIITGGLLLLISTYLFHLQLISPITWMISIGFAMYLAYISYHTMLFERWIATFKYQSNVGFLMYLADSFGYIGSVSVLFIKNFGSNSISWLEYIKFTTYITGLCILILGVLALFYFDKKYKRTIFPNQIDQRTQFA